MADDKIEIEIVLDDGSIKKGFGKLKKESKKTGDTVEKNLTAGFGKIAAAATAAAAAIVSVLGAREAIQAARAQEDAVNRFNTALRLSGKFTQELSRDFQKFASGLQAVTKVGDETTLEVASLIQGLGQLEGKALKEATKAAIDLSAALGVDLNAAALLVGKAAAGEVSSFSRYGLIIKKGADNAETFARALDGINSKFGGAAEAQVQTFSGRIEQLGNAFGDVLEGFGDFIVKVPIFSKIIGIISQNLLTASDDLKSFTDSKSEVDALSDSIVDFGQNVVFFVIAPLEEAINFFTIFKNSILLSANALTATFVTIGAEITNALLFPLEKIVVGLAKLAKQIPGVSKDIQNGLQDAAVSVINLRDNIDLVGETTREETVAAFDDLKSSIEAIGDAELSQKLFTQLEELRSTAIEVSNTAIQARDSVTGGAAPAGPAAPAAPLTGGAVLPQGVFAGPSPLEGAQLGVDAGAQVSEGIFGITDEKFEAIKNNFVEFQKLSGEARKKLSADFKATGVAFRNGFGNAIGSGFAAFGKSLAQGENALEAFGKAFIGAIGSQAISEGTAMILRGLGYLADPFLAGFGPGLIAKGSALAAFGGVLSAVGGGGGAPAGGGGVASASPEAPGTTLAEGPESVDEKVTQVNIDVAGQVLNPLEVGNQLAQVLNDAFEAGGTKVVTA